MSTLVNQVSCATYFRGSKTNTSFTPTSIKMAKHRGSWSPSKHSDSRCSMLLLSNLATPEWVSINCTGLIVPDIVCEKSGFFPDEKELKAQDLLVCWPTAVMHDNQCFLFLWLEGKSSVSSYSPRMCSFGRITTIVMKTLQFIFDAVSTPFPPLLSPGTHSSFSYRKYFNKYCYESSSSQVEGYHMCGSDLIQLDESVMANMFKCMDGSHVSLVYICDERTHCPGRHLVDELHCRKGKAKENTSQSMICTEHNNFMYSNANSTCLVFLDKSMENTPHFNQLISLDNGVQMGTTNTGQFLNCFHSDTQQYFDISDICKYKLNEKNQLSPCASGEHMESCENYECNMMFKCQMFYCIPWAYTCDGKWDCPYGSDEPVSCKAERTCSLMFRCADSRVCIHLGNICDGISDCKLKEDESFCILASVTCPKQCNCLGFAVQCRNGTGFGIQKLPYSLITLKSMIVLSLDHILYALQNAKFFTLSGSQLSFICGKYQQHKDIQLIDNNQNSIAMLNSHCICCLDKLSVIKVDLNCISTVAENAFQNLPKLTLINMSSNHLTSLESDFISETIKSITLSMLDVSDTAVTFDIFQDLQLREMETDLYELCCLVNQVTVCQAVQPWYRTCHTILKRDTPLNILYGSVALYTLGTNLLVFLWHQVSQSKVLGILIASVINLHDALCGLFFCGIWVFNMVSSSFAFLNQINPTNKMVCFTCSLLLIYCSLSAPSLLMLQGISRRSVVAFPFDSKFKCAVFVKKCLMLVVLTTASFAILFTVSFQLLFIKVADNFCLMFVDPGSDSLVLTFLNLTCLSYHVTVQSVTIATHVMIAKELLKSDKQLTQSVRLTKGMAVQLVVPCVFVVISWVPLDLLFLVLSFLSHYPLELIFWATGLLTPLTATVNPPLYFFTLFRKEQ